MLTFSEHLCLTPFSGIYVVLLVCTCFVVDIFFSSPLLCFVLAIVFSDLDLFTASHDSFDSFKL